MAPFACTRDAPAVTPAGAADFTDHAFVAGSYCQKSVELPRNAYMYVPLVAKEPPLETVAGVEAMEAHLLDAISYLQKSVRLAPLKAYKYLDVGVSGAVCASVASFVVTGLTRSSACDGSLK